jgi:hypothetical protein
MLFAAQMTARMTVQRAIHCAAKSEMWVWKSAMRDKIFDEIAETAPSRIVIEIDQRIKSNILIYVSVDLKATRGDKIVLNIAKKV